MERISGTSVVGGQCLVFVRVVGDERGRAILTFNGGEADCRFVCHGDGLSCSSRFAGQDEVVQVSIGLFTQS
jgi:hypothetical protein